MLKLINNKFNPNYYAQMIGYNDEELKLYY